MADLCRHVAPVRLQLSRARGFRLGPNARSVARPGLFGNPWIAGSPGRIFVETFGLQRGFTARIDLTLGHTLSAAAAVEAYRGWLAGETVVIASEAPTEIIMAVLAMLARRRVQVLEDLVALAGNNLACWCKPGAPCHADVLLELANTLPMESPR